MTRETEQLLAVANHYLAEGRRLLKSHPYIASKTIGEITRMHRTQSLSPAEKVLAHFGSAAVRLATVCEIAGYAQTKNYRGKFYEKSGDRKSGWPPSKIRAAISAKLQEHLHLLLRDNVAHEEPGVANKKPIAADRFAVLKTTTIDTCSKVLSSVAKRSKGSCGRWAEYFGRVARGTIRHIKKVSCPVRFVNYWCCRISLPILQQAITTEARQEDEMSTMRKGHLCTYEASRSVESPRH
jgi:hypothetical protein